MAVHQVLPTLKGAGGVQKLSKDRSIFTKLYIVTNEQFFDSDSFKKSTLLYIFLLWLQIVLSPFMECYQCISVSQLSTGLF